MIRLINKLRGRAKLTVSRRLLRLAVVFGKPALASWVLDSVAWRVPQTRRADGSARPVVLCLGRTIFVDDIKALARYSGRFEYAVVHLMYWDVIFKSFFSKEELGSITEGNYHHDESTRAGKERYAEFLRQMWPSLAKRFVPLSAVMTGNFDYLVQQELGRVAEERGVPFIVMHKEGLVGFGGEEFAAPYREFVFPGSKAMVYNDRAKQALLGSAMPGLSEDKLEIIGVPRLDRYQAEKGSDYTKKQIVFFSFSTQDRFHYLADDEKKFNSFNDRARDFHLWVMQFALRHPQIKVVIKTKNAQHYLEYVTKIQAENFRKPIPNLEVTNTANPQQLIADSFAVLGYNSTTMIEGMLAGKIIVTPDFADLIPDDSTDFFQDYPDLLHFTHSAEELDDALSGRTETPPSAMSRREEFLREYVYRADGQASVRAENAIHKVIDQRRAGDSAPRSHPSDKHQPVYSQTDHK